MAIAFDTASISAGGESKSTITWSHTCSGTNRCLFVTVIGAIALDRITGATYNGVAMTLVDKIIATGDRYIYLFILKNPASGSNSVVVSSSPADSIYPGASSYTGVLQTGTFDATNKGSTAAANTLTVTTTTIANNCWVFAATRSATNTLSPGAGAHSVGFDNQMVDSGLAKTPAGNYSMTINESSGLIMAMICASFAPANLLPGGGTLPMLGV